MIGIGSFIAAYQADFITIKQEEVRNLGRISFFAADKTSGGACNFEIRMNVVGAFFSASGANRRTNILVRVDDSGITEIAYVILVCINAVGDYFLAKLA